MEHGNKTYYSPLQKHKFGQIFKNYKNYQIHDVKPVT